MSVFGRILDRAVAAARAAYRKVVDRVRRRPAAPTTPPTAPAPTPTIAPARTPTAPARTSIAPAPNVFQSPPTTPTPTPKPTAPARPRPPVADAARPRLDAGPLLDARGLADARRRLAEAARAERLTRAFNEGRMTDGQRRRLQARVARHAYAEFRAGADLLIKGDLSLADWYRQMTRAVASTSAAAGMASTGRGTLDADTLRSVREQASRQLRYLARFRRQLAAEAIPLDGRVSARAGLYANAAFGIAENVRRAAAIQAGGFERRVLGHADRHCPSCLEYAELGWRPAGTLPAIGDSICQALCNCHFEFRLRAPKATPKPRPTAPAPAPKPAPAPAVAVPADFVAFDPGLTLADVADFEAALQSIPAATRRAIYDAGGRVVLARRLRDVRPDLAATQPRGWPEGMTWEHVDGMYDSPTRQAIATVEYREGDRYVQSRQKAGVLRHELGHAADRALARGGLSDSPAFLAAYRADVAALEPYLHDRLAYYLQGGIAGPQEAFAELFAQAHGGGSDPGNLTSPFPRAAAFIREASPK